MRYTSIALATLLACSTVLAAPAAPSAKSARPQAGKAGWQRAAPVPAWAQPLAEIPATERLDAVVLRLDETQALAGDQPAFLVNRAIQVNDRSALPAIGQLSLSYQADYQTLSLHRVAILRDGKVLDRTASVDARVLQREDALGQGMYGGASTVQLLLEDVRVGDTLWLTYSVAGANPVFGKQWFDEFAWDRLTPIELRRLTVLYPRDRKPAWRQLGDYRSDRIVPRSASSGPYEMLVFEGRGIDEIEAEPSIARDYLAARTLQFSEFPDWASVARWASGLFPPTAGSPALKALADQFRSQATPAARAAAALNWVQDEIRYFSVAIGENSHKPQAPATVLQRRYGDCKDKSYLLIALLGELGIKARPVLLSASAPQTPAKGGPSPGWFDHVIVELQVDGKPYYVDPTASGQQVPLDKLSTPFPGAAGLPVDPSATALIVLPERQQDVPEYEVAETITVADYEGDAALAVREIFRGSMAEGARPAFAALSPVELKRAALKDYEKRYPGVVLLEAPVVADDRQANQLELRARFRLPKAVRQVDGNRAIDYKVRPLEGVMALPDKLARQFPLEMPAARFHGRYRLDIVWPDDVRARQAPWSRYLDNRFFQAQESYVFRGNQVTHMVDYRARMVTVPAAEVPALHAQGKQLDELGYGRYSLRESDRIGPQARGCSARDVDLVRMAAAAGELAQLMEKQDDSKIDRDHACLLVQAARDAQGLLEPASLKVLARAQRIIKDDASNPVARACRARLSFQAGDYAGSARLYRELDGGVHGKDAMGLRDLAWALLEQGQLEQASAAMQRYLEVQARLDPATGAELDIIDQVALLQRSGRPLPPGAVQRAASALDAPWPRPLLAMQAGLLGQEALLAQVDAMPEHARAYALTEALFYIGQQHLGANDKAGALAAFRRLEETGIRSSPLYFQGMAKLRALVGVQAAAQDKPDVRQLTERANGGDAQAQLALGWAYETGRGVAVDLATAAQWYRKAADNGDERAYFALSELHRLGQGVPQDEDQAVALLRTSAELGNAHAMAMVGWRYLDGKGYPKDPAYAILWFQRAAARGSTAGGYALGQVLYEGRGVERNLAAAAAMYRAAAEQGSADAQLDLGYMYEKGEGLAKDMKQAVAWYRKSAEQGNAIAQHNLGLRYEFGDGVAQDEKTAISWYRKSAQQGYMMAMTKYGYMLESATTVPRDPVQAHGWYLKSAQLDDAVAQYNLGQQYKYGRGVKEDPLEAYKWYLKAAQNGDLDAMTEVASTLQDGEIVPGDLAQAVRWMTAAADGGEAVGILRLGIMYVKGSGVARDYGRASALFDKAGAAGQEAAYYWLGLIHEDGLGRERDAARARALYAQAPQVEQANIRLAVLRATGQGGPRDIVYARDLVDRWAKEGDTAALERLARAFDDGQDAAFAQQVRARLQQMAKRS